MNCKNCATRLEETDDYCRNCGGKVIRNRLTFKNLFHHINETYFNYDNKLLRTFVNLFAEPEDVINGYINGVRKKYVDVVSYFALAITLSGLQIFILNKIGLDFGVYDTSTEQGKMQAKMSETIFKYTTDYQSLIMMLYIPIYALMARLIFRKYKKFNYAELLVIFMYAQAHFSICSAVLFPLLALGGSSSLGLLGFLAVPLQITFFAYILKRVYSLSVKQILARTLLFLILLTFLFVLIVVIITLVMVKTGMFDKAAG